MRVAIHRNLTTKKWVISETKMTRNGERKSSIIDKGADAVYLKDVVFVTPTQKTLGRITGNLNNPDSKYGREVCAYAIGTICDPVECDTHCSWNPNKGTDFYTPNGTAKTNYDNASFEACMMVK
jgi:hypothetical protein|tara:strand:+ start:110 stop:481 length:372 start_codon:yes stop_codon:yes gene_type:complete